MSLPLLLGKLAATGQVRDAAEALAEACRSCTSASAVAVRTLDLRDTRQVQWLAVAGVLRADVPTRRLAIERAALRSAELGDVWRVVDAVVETMRWESPFVDAPFGFTLPLVAAGELCGALDIGYRALPGDGVMAGEAQALAPVAQAVAMAARAERLRRDLTGVRDYHAQVIDNANLYMLGVERGWRIHVANKALLQAVGRSRHELIGRDLRDGLPVENRQQIVALFEQAFDGRSHVGVPITLTLPAGVRLETVWNCAPVSVVGNEVRSIVAIGQDVSQLAKLREKMVRNERFAAVGQVTAGVVHELNNPLTLISVYAEQLLQRAHEPTAWGEPERAKLLRIEESIRRILRLCRDLVDYSRAPSDEFEVLDLALVTAKALSFCEHEYSPSEVELNVDIAESQLVRGVAAQLERVVINLVMNALQAMQRRGRLAVRVFAKQGEVGLLVADSGPGVADADKARIFEPFFSTKRDGEGTGLGLSIVKNIVEAHGGRIDVRDSDFGGAAFVVWLPGISK